MVSLLLLSCRMSPLKFMVRKWLIQSCMIVAESVQIVPRSRVRNLISVVFFSCFTSVGTGCLDPGVVWAL